MTSSEQNYWRILDLYIVPAMSVLGFERKRKEYFYVMERGCTKRVACGFNKRRGEDAGSMTVTVCVGFPELEEFLSRCPELSTYVNIRMDKQGCTMATDLGHLTAPFKYLSWEVAPESDLAQIGTDIVARIRRDGVRYFTEYGRVDLAVAAWKQGITFNMGSTAALYLAADEWLRGSPKMAIKQLVDVVNAEELPSTKNMYSCLLSWLQDKQLTERRVGSAK